MNKYLLSAVFMVLAATSWQVWRPLENNLTVYYGQDASSELCYTGGAEYYDGHCVINDRPTSQYEERVRLEQEAASQIE